MAIQRECGDTLQVQAGMRDVEVPRSIPKLTTRRVLTMSFVEGDPITRLKVHLKACCPTAHSMVMLLCEVQCCFVKSDLNSMTITRPSFDFCAQPIQELQTLTAQWCKDYPKQLTHISAYFPIVLGNFKHHNSDPRHHFI